MKAKSSGAGAMFMERRVLELELCYFYDSAALGVILHIHQLDMMNKQTQINQHHLPHIH